MAFFCACRSPLHGVAACGGSAELLQIKYNVAVQLAVTDYSAVQSSAVVWGAFQAFVCTLCTVRVDRHVWLASPEAAVLRSLSAGLSIP